MFIGKLRQEALKRFYRKILDEVETNAKKIYPKIKVR